MAEAEAILPFPEAPRKAQIPKCFHEHESFSCITAKVSQIIEALPSSQWTQLSAFMQSALYPGVPEGKAPAIPSSPNEFMRHLQQYWDPLNIEPFKVIGSFLKDADLTRQLEEYERTLSDQLEQATWDSQVDVAPPPEYKIMLIKMKKQGNTTVREAVEVRNFLAEHHMFKGQHGILCLAGLANDSLVFYIAEGNIGPMLQRMQHDNDEVLAEGVEQVTMVKLAKLDVASGHITPHPDVPKIDPTAECPEFGVLLIGETGSGKSTLINNLLALGEVVAPEGHTCDSETATITQYQAKVTGVPVTLYDTPGMNDSRAMSNDLCREIKSLITSKKVCLTIFCFPMTEKRLKPNHISTMQAYHEAIVNWDSTIMTLTFADMLKASHSERKSEGFNEAGHFQRKITEWKGKLKDALVQEVGVSPSVAKSLIIRPTMDDWESKLLDNEDWFIPLWLDILDLLAPAAYLRFLEIHQNNITFEEATDVSGKLITTGEATEVSGKIVIKGKDKKRFWWIAENKAAIVCTGVGGAAATAGAVTTIAAAGVGIAGAATAAVVGGAAIAGVALVIGGAIIAIGGAAALIHNVAKNTKET